MRLRIPFFACLSLWSLSACGAEKILTAHAAKLIGPNIKIEQGTQIAYWKAGESAEWTVMVDQNMEQDLIIHYSSPQTPFVEAWLDGVKVSALQLPSTKNWKKYEYISLGKVALKKGAHTLRLTVTKGEKFCLNVMQASFSDGLPMRAELKSVRTSVPDQVLHATKATLIGANIKMQDQQVAYWKKGEAAEWAFTSAEEVVQALFIHYSAVKPVVLSVWLDGKKVFDPSLPGTTGFGSYNWGSLGKVALTKGDHTLRLRAEKGSEYCLNVRLVTFTSDASFGRVEKKDVSPSDSISELPALYSDCGTWAETMVAMRNAFLQPRTQQRVGNKDLPLNEADGAKLWATYPKECDWFLQDNQLHGDWGIGRYDARQDYRFYFKADRDSLLEQKLIESVLKELEVPGLHKKLADLVARKCTPDNPAWLKLYVEACGLRRQTRLAPLLKQTNKLIYATHMNMGTIYLATETQGCGDGSQLRMIDLGPEKDGLPLKDELLFDSNNGIVRDPELSFDGKKVLFAWRKTNKQQGTTGSMAPTTGNYKIYEMDLATRVMRPLTSDDTYGADFEPCYLPNGDIAFSSVRCVQEVTCGWGDCSNLYLMNKDGKYARRVGFDQTQTGFPHLLNDGRVIFTRRDYNDRGQSYAHALFVMNIDGTTQTEYYGNNSMAPTSIQHTRAIPGSRKTMGIAGGYHTSQGGKLVVIDPTEGRQNYDGLTFLNWTPTPLAQVNDENYCRVGEQYAYPYPFDENSFLASFSPEGVYMTASNGKLDKAKEQGRMLYKLYYMTMDGTRELLAAHPTLSCTQAIPVRARIAPQARASFVDYTKTTGTCYVQDVYYGPSAEGIPRGSIKKLRVCKLFYKPITIGAGGWSPDRKDVGPGRKYSGYGWHSVLPTGVGSSSFDAKEILGEVDVHADGSAMFEIPARTPVFFQLVDENGLVAQTMRSWATLMPNERFSCVGCHEENDSAPLPQAQKTMAMQRPPQKLQHVDGITGSPFSYAKRVQPILNKHCVVCHAPGKKGGKIDLTDTIVADNPNDKWASSTRHKFYQSYLTLLQVKWHQRNNLEGMSLDEGRPNKWVSYYTRMATVELTPPYYAGSTQSGIIKMMQDGHGKTQLTHTEIATVAAWIDMNVPFIGEYDEMTIWDEATQAKYDNKLDMRRKQEQIEVENIKAYIESGQQ